MYLDDCVCVLPDLTWLPLLGVGRKSWYIMKTLRLLFDMTCLVVYSREWGQLSNSYFILVVLSFTHVSEDNSPTLIWYDLSCRLLTWVMTTLQLSFEMTCLVVYSREWWQLSDSHLIWLVLSFTHVSEDNSPTLIWYDLSRRLLTWVMTTLQLSFDMTCLVVYSHEWWQLSNSLIWLVLSFTHVSDDNSPTLIWYGLSCRLPTCMSER